MKQYRTAVLLANLGTPSAPTAAAVRAFLKPFLNDRRVVEVPRPIWSIILNGFILPFRPKPVAEGYRALWDHYGDSPLRLYAKQQVDKLQARCDADDAAQGTARSVIVDFVFSYGEPGLTTQLNQYREVADQVVILPLYPQYSCSTTAAIYDQLARYNLKQRYVADVHIVREYYQHSSFRQALAQSVSAFWQEHGRGDKLLVSYHGVPKAYADKGDPYYQQCLQTSEHLVGDLGLNDDQHCTSFQSRLGKAEWLTPYTDVTVKALAQQGVKTLDVVCPSFSVDCLETLEEITVENGDYFTQAGGHKLRLIPCLNADDSHVQMMADILQPYLQLAAETKQV